MSKDHPNATIGVEGKGGKMLNTFRPHGDLSLESVELDEVLSDREMERFTKAHTALHMKMHKQALQIIKFIDSVEKHKDKWTDSFGEYVKPKLSKELKLSNPNSVEYQQGRGRGDWSFLIQHGNVRYNNRDMPWMPKSGELPFDKFMNLLDIWKKNANKPKSTGSHMGRQTESIELDEVSLKAKEWIIVDRKTGEVLFGPDSYDAVEKQAEKKHGRRWNNKLTLTHNKEKLKVGEVDKYFKKRSESVELGEGKAWDDIVDIQQKHQVKKVHGVLVDAQTARLLVQIHNSLDKSKNKKSFIDTINKDRRGLEKMVEFAWSQVGSTSRGHSR